MLLDDFMPRYDFSDKHSTIIHASPERIFQTFREGTPDVLLRLLFNLRDLPGIVRGRRDLQLSGDRPMAEQMLEKGFTLLGEEPNEEVVVGLIARFWQLRGGYPVVKVNGPAEFMRFDRPGYGKAALNLYVDSSDEVSTCLRTETRVSLSHPADRKKFSYYWKAIRPGVRLTRRMMLRGIRQGAEQR